MMTGLVVALEAESSKVRAQAAVLLQLADTCSNLRDFLYLIVKLLNCCHAQCVYLLLRVPLLHARWHAPGQLEAAAAAAVGQPAAVGAAQRQGRGGRTRHRPHHHHSRRLGGGGAGRASLARQVRSNLVCGYSRKLGSVHIGRGLSPVLRALASGTCWKTAQ